MNHTRAFLLQRRAAASGAIAEVVALVESDAFQNDVKAVMRSRQVRRCYFRHAARSTFCLFSVVTEAYYDWQREKSDARLHALRIALKKFRYACEIYRELYGRGMRRLIQRLKTAQDCLGEWHDYCVLNGYIKEAMETAPDAARPGIEALSAAAEKEAQRRKKAFTRAARLLFSNENEEEICEFLLGKKES